MPLAVVPPGVELHFESFGSPDDPLVVLVAGLGAQLLAWDRRLCEMLVERGLRVVRFDNRDCGLSTKFDDVTVDLPAVMAAASSGEYDTAQRLARYTLREMADDVVGLVSALGCHRAHVVGASMGGMIAQLVAARRPDVVVSLTSIMSSTGESHVGRSTPEAVTALMSPPAASRGDFVDAAVRGAKVWGSRRYVDEAAVAELAETSYDRSYCPQGTMRQLAALLATGPLDRLLSTLDVPTLVVHGLDDTLITPSGGARTAELVRGAELMLVADIGHDRPEPLWPMLCDRIAAHVHAAERASGAAGAVSGTADPL